MLGFLSREEMLAVIGEPGSTWTSQRDHLLLAMLYNTGARVSEIVCRTCRRCRIGRFSLCPPARQGPQAACSTLMEVHG